ncbi:MAG TPA: DVUA0089 family protein, partial [Opitutaceae bacterium]|nr:DVUA0089 family protein [Opitutaceae bacterium]
GVALAEIYDADVASPTSRLMNVSTRGNAASGGDALIGGFVISGSAAKRVLLRGAGPSLTQFGVTGALTDPTLALYDGSGRQLGSNDNWVSAAPQLSAAMASVGAYALTADSKDAAVMATLPPGAYTVQVTGVNNTAGTALIEIYELP